MNIIESVNSLIEKNKDKITFVSMSDPVIVKAHELLNDKCKDEDVFITEGMWSIPKIVYNNCEVEAFIFCPQSIKTQDGIDAIKTFLEQTKVYVISEKVQNKLTKRNDDNGIYCIVKMPKTDIDKILKQSKSTICILDGIEKPGNIGTILRTSDATNTDLVVVVNRRAKITNTLSVKGSMGGIFNVPIMSYNNTSDLIKKLNDFGYTIYLADTRAKQDYFNTSYDDKVALVMGSERYGISKEWYDYPHKMIKLKMLGQCDSLNVGVATSVLLYDIKMKRLGD